MRRIILISTLLLLVSLNFTIVSADKFVVVIDAGHGGKDGGAIRGTYKEKEINLNVALALGKLIETNMNDIKVVYTRKSDVFVDLYKRADIANKAKANLFISIHTNSTAAKTTTASGADTYILGLARSEENLAVAKRENSVILLEDNYNKRYEGFDPNSPESNIIFEFMTDKYMEQSLQFATNVQSGFSRVAKRVDRGVLQAGFLVLRESGMPSVLIELGFINNPAEAKYLSSSIGQRAMASAIYSGLERYKKDFDKKQGRSSTSVSDTPKQSVPKQEPKKDKADNYKAEVISVSSRNIEDTVSKEKETAPRNAFISKNNRVEDLPSNNSKRTTAPAPKNDGNSHKLSKVVSDEKPVQKDVQVITPKQSKSSSKSNAKIPAGALEYRVQFMTGNTKLNANSTSFKGLSPVDSYLDGNVYKYTYGSTTSEVEAAALLKEAKKKFGDAFIVRFKNNIRVK